MKKSIVAQQLVNFYPDWSRVRSDDQSNGYQFLNVIANKLEDLDKYLFKMERNNSLITANIDEIDWLSKVYLGTSFTFDEDTSDRLSPKKITPTVRGEVINNTYSGYQTIAIAPNNDLQSLWYDAVPTRVDLEQTMPFSGESLLTWFATDFPFSGELHHHLGGGRVYVETVSGTQYVTINDDNKVDRGEVILRGETRKGTIEAETLIFPWDQKQPTRKEWKIITDVETYNLEDQIVVSIRSGDFAQEDYQSFYNMRYSDTDKKVDEFWSIDEFGSGTRLDRVGYVADDWQTILLGFSEKEVKDSWELLDDAESSISLVDMAIQPFTNRIWAIAENAKLYCYSLDEEMVSNIDFLSLRTVGCEVQLEFESRKILLGETIQLDPLHIRPLQEISKYRIWYQTPAGVKYGLLNGTPVSYTSDFWSYTPELSRQIESTISLVSAERGEYGFVIEVVYADGTNQNDRAIVTVQSKEPLATIDLSTHLIGATIMGIDFDADQKMWIKTSLGYYQFSLHTDLMLVDFDNKILYFREDYHSIEVE
jgi:hypothetical protein